MGRVTRLASRLHEILRTRRRAAAQPAATEAPMPTPDKLREIAAAALEQLPDEVRSRLEADAAEIPHRALRRAFLRAVGYTLARCRQGQPDVPTLTLRALVGTPRWCATAIDRAVRLGWLRIEREADRLEHRCRRFAPGPQAGAPAPDPPSGCIIEFPMQHWSIVEFPLVHMSFLGTHNDPKGERSDRSTPHTRSDRSTPHTRSDRSTPHTRSDRENAADTPAGDKAIAGRRAPPEQLPRPPTGAGESTGTALGTLAADTKRERGRGLRAGSLRRCSPRSLGAADGT